MTIAIVLVNWNGWRDCVDCIDSVLGSDSPPLHIYLVDNDSADGSVQHLVDWCTNPVRAPEAKALPGALRYTDHASGQAIAFRLIDDLSAPAPLQPECRLSIINSGGNLGFAGGNNVGLRLGLRDGCDWFWLLNTDTVMRHDALSCLLARAQREPGIGITGSTLVYHGSPDRVQALAGELDLQSLTPSHLSEGLAVVDVPGDPAAIEAHMDYVVGASMFVPRAFVEQIGLMQEDYFLYYEELDWALRGKAHFKLAWAPDSIVWHKVGGSTSRGESRVSLFSLSLLYRNRIKFVARFFPERMTDAKLGLWRLVLFYCSRLMFREARIVASALFNARELIRQGQRS